MFTLIVIAVVVLAPGLGLEIRGLGLGWHGLDNMSLRLFGTKTERVSTTQKHTKNIPYMKNVKPEKWRWNWRISQSTIKIWIWRSFIKLHKNLKNLNWTFKVFKKNLKTRFLQPNSTALVAGTNTSKMMNKRIARFGQCRDLVDASHQTADTLPIGYTRYM